jgi:hypothetical protein
VVAPAPPAIDERRASPEVHAAGMALIFDSMYEDHQLIRAMRTKGASAERILETKRALNRAAINASEIYSKGAKGSTPRKVDRRKPLS